LDAIKDRCLVNNDSDIWACYPDEDDVHTKTIRAALMQCQGWRDLDEWHDDDGSCLFMFFTWTGKRYEYYDTLFTSPLCNDWPDMKKHKLWCKFQKITTDFELPTTPPASTETEE